NNSGVFRDDADDTLTITASQGALTDHGDGTWSWTQTGEENNSGTVTITASNGGLATATTTFDVTFREVAPTFVSQASDAITTDEGTAANNSGLFRDDADDTITITASQGTLTDHGDGTWSWTQTEDESDSGTVTITARNGGVATATTTFDVTFREVAPRFVSQASDAITTDEGTAAKDRTSVG